MAIKFGYNNEKFIGSRTVAAKKNELVCRICGLSVNREDKEKYYCGEQKFLICNRCVLERHGSIFHYDIKIDKVEVEK